MKTRFTINDCKIISLPKIHNRAGNIIAIHNSQEIPFDIKRIYYLYDVPAGVERGGHSHIELQQLIVAASGSFDVVLDDGEEIKTVSLSQPNIGLLMVPGIWRELKNFSSGSICMVLASIPYCEDDYIRDYDEFKKLVLQ